MNSPLLLTLAFVSYTFSLGGLIFGSYIKRSKPENPVNHLYLVVAISFSIYTLFCSFFYLAESPAAALVIFKGMNISGMFIFPSFLHFFYCFKHGPLKWKKMILLYFPYIILVFDYLGGSLFILGAKTPCGWEIRLEEFNPALGYVFLFLISYALSIIAALVRWKIKARSKIEKSQAGILLVFGILPLALLSLTVFLFFRIEGTIRTPYLSQFSTALLFTGMGYILFKYQFLRISPTFILQELLNSMHDFFILLDKKGKVLQFNRQLENMLASGGQGFDVSLVKLKREEKTYSLISYLETFAEKGALDIELFYAQTGPFPVRLRCFPVRRETGTPVGFAVLGKDIREQIQLEEVKAVQAEMESSLEDTKTQYKQTLDSLEDYIFVANKEMKVELCNLSLKEFFKKNNRDCSRGECPIVGQNLRDLEKRWPFMAEREIVRIFETGESAAFQREVVLGERHYQLQINRIPVQEKGQVARVITIFRDITRQKMEEMRILRSGRLDSLGTLAGGIAHDFNNILTGILGNNMLLKELSSDDGLKDFITGIERGCEKARKLTSQLLTFSRGGAPCKKTGALRELIRETGNFVLSGSNIGFDFPQESPVPLTEFDHSQISWVLQNLFLNAREAMEEGGTIHCSLSQVTIEKTNIFTLPPGPYLSLTIRDEGPGIDSAILPKIFDPYFTTKKSSAGLGLSICFSILKRHGGAIDVKSFPRKGTEFTVLLPVLESSGAAEELTGTGEPLRGKTLLVLEDEKEIRQLIGKMAERFDHQVIFALTGEEALEIYFERSPEIHILLLDLTIKGGMGGQQVMKELGSKFRSVNSIVCSGYSNSPVMSNFKDYGFKGVLKKPFSLEDFNRALKSVWKG